MDGERKSRHLHTGKVGGEDFTPVIGFGDVIHDSGSWIVATPRETLEP